MDETLGAPVVDATTQPGGMSPGAAARVLLADGRRAFVKAVGSALNPDSPALFRHEVRVLGALPSAPYRIAQAAELTPPPVAILTFADRATTRWIPRWAIVAGEPDRYLDPHPMILRAGPR